MRKVGIVTMHQFHNHGSMLQAYATQKVISDLGYDCQIIDYRYPNQLHRSGRSLKARLLKSLHSAVKPVFAGNQFQRAAERFEAFAGRLYNLSQPYPDAGAIQADPPLYDIYVSGSDQIWNPIFVKNDPTFFLDFAPEGKRRISYASSFGQISLPEDYRELYKGYLEKFDCLGVREQPGVDIIRDLTGREAQLVLDPTLLVSKEDWDAVTSPREYDEPYILCYGSPTKSRHMEKFALYLQKHTGYRILRMQGKAYETLNRQMKFIFDAGPSQWLSLVAGAAVILAQSFHGTAFAVNLGTPFFSMLRGEVGVDSRQTNILKMLHLEDRAVQNGGEFPSPKDLEIDLSNAQAILAEKRERSLDYLKNALSGGGEDAS